MEVKLVPCHVDRDFFICLARDYVEELKKYREDLVWDEKTWDEYIWESKFIVSGGILCGFVCSEEVSFLGKRKILFIHEFFVSEDERRRKVGLEAVRALVKGWKGDVGLYVLDGNEGAKGFWKAVEEELGWERVKRSEIREEKGCELRFYRAKE